MDLEDQARMALAPNRGLTLGSQFMAVVFDALLCGVVIVQCCQWAPNYRNDSLLIRVVLQSRLPSSKPLSVITRDSADESSTCGIYMQAFVYDFGSYALFADFKYFGVYPMLDVLTVVPVQITFADRSMKINDRSIVVTVLNYSLIALTFACATSVTALSRGLSIFTKTDALAIFLVLWPAVCTVTHLTLTGTILWGLLKTREGSRQTNQVVDRVIFMSLESQAPGTLFAFAAMIVVASNVNSPFLPWVVIIHPKVFLIGCLAMVNTRHSWQSQGKLPSTIHSSRHSSQPRLSRSLGSTHGHGDLNTPPPVRPGSVMVTTFDDFDGPGMQLQDIHGQVIDDKANLEAIGVPLPVQPKSHLSMV